MRLAAALLCATLLSGCAVGGGAHPGKARPHRSAVPPSTPPSPQETALPQGHYTFLNTTEDGSPVRWSSCDPIAYVVRPANRPRGARQLLTRSIREISSVTGLDFVRHGTTTEAPEKGRALYQPKRYGPQWAPVLIAFSDPEEYPPLAGSQAGYGGAAYVDSGRTQPQYVTGSVVFDAPQLARFRSRQRVKAVMVHELAHLVGLGHVKDPRQLMHRVQRPGDATQLQDGDRAGLEALGAGPCLRPLDPTEVAAELED